MKKLVVILLLLVYGTTTIGATVHMHYCMDEFVGWSLFHDDDNTCGNCGMEEKDNGDCCKDEQKLVKLSVDQQQRIANQLAEFIAAPAVLTQSFSFEVKEISTLAQQAPLISQTPPGVNRKRLHLLHNVFLI